MSKEIISADERLDSVNEKITLIQKKDGLTFGTDAFLLAAFYWLTRERVDKLFNTQLIIFIILL